MHRSLLTTLAAVALLAACGGDGSGSPSTETPVAPADTAASVDTVSSGDTGDDTEAPVDETFAPLPGLRVLDVFEITVDAPAHLAGSLRLDGLASIDPLDAPTCSPSTDFIDLSYLVESAEGTGFAFDTFMISGPVDGPGTTTAAFTFESDVPPPNGGMPFTSMTGTEGDLTVVGEGEGTFSVDDGYGNMITGSYTCTYTE